MERAREHAQAPGGTTGSPPKEDADEGEGAGGADEENVFASSDGGDQERGDSSGGGAGAGGGAGSMSVAEGIRSLIRATWEDVKDWCDEEAEARVRRKDAQVRTLVVQGFNSPPA